MYVVCMLSSTMITSINIQRKCVRKPKIKTLYIVRTYVHTYIFKKKLNNNIYVVMFVETPYCYWWLLMCNTVNNGQSNKKLNYFHFNFSV